MKFNYDEEKKEYVCPICGARYSQYNSLFKHYQRKHESDKENVKGKLHVIAQPSKISSRDDSMNEFEVKSLGESVNKPKDVKNNKPNKTKLYLTLFIAGLFVLYILYKRGFFNPILNRSNIER